MFVEKQTDPAGRSHRTKTTISVVNWAFDVNGVAQFALHGLLDLEGPSYFSSAVAPESPAFILTRDQCPDEGSVGMFKMLGRAPVHARAGAGCWSRNNHHAQ